MPHLRFDRSRLHIQPLVARRHDLTLAHILPLDATSPAFGHPALPVLGERLVAARRDRRARILMMGAHVLRAGVQRHLVDLLERGLIDHVAMNGAGPIHDALIVLDQVGTADCGVVTARVREELAGLADRDPAAFVLADSREHVGVFRNVALKPNLAEALQALGVSDAAEPAVLRAHVSQLAAQAGRTVFCTRGALGMVVARPDGAEVVTVPAYPVAGPIDPVGAGDSASAGIASAIAAGLDPVAAAAFGNLVASITVRQIGTTGTASPALVRRRWCDVCGSSA
jgi:hypothetical protein